MSQKLRIHFLVPEEAGVVESGGLNLNGPHGQLVPYSPPGRYRVACDPTIIMSDWDRGTGEPWAVACVACSQTEVFKRLYRPAPGSDGPPDESEEMPSPEQLQRRATPPPTVALAKKTQVVPPPEKKEKTG